jgi:hypothetical protein
MSEQFYVRRGSKTQGPFPLEKLKQLAESGRLNRSDKFSKSESGPWQPAGSIKQLANLIGDHNAGSESGESKGPSWLRIGGFGLLAVTVVGLAVGAGMMLAGKEHPPDGKDLLTNTIGMRFVPIPPGTFTMGDGEDAHREAHKVTLTQSFHLGQHEVTQEQYEKVMGKNPSQFKGKQNPVEKVSWNDAVEFCRKLSELSEEKSAGYVYRLPTEAEWEYSCRAGTTTTYSFGDSEAGAGDYAWYGKNSGKTTHPVGQKKPNAWGLL